MKKIVYGVVPVSGPVLARPSTLATLRAVPVAMPENLAEKAMFAASFGVLLGVLFGLL